MGWEKTAVAATGMVHPRVSPVLLPSPVHGLSGEEQVFKI